MRRVTSERLDNLEQVIAVTCCLVLSGDEIQATHVITPRQPKYRELMRYRSVAEGHGCSMTVLRSSAGSVIRFRADRTSQHQQRGCRSTWHARFFSLVRLTRRPRGRVTKTLNPLIHPTQGLAAEGIQQAP